MKMSNGTSSVPESTREPTPPSSRNASDRRPSTVVGFKADSAIAPWSKWANRWVVAAIIQGALAAGATAFLLYDSKYGNPGASRIVAGAGSSGGGIWMTVGFLGFIIFGPLAAAVTSLFYQHLESNLRAPYTGMVGNVLAWLHLVLMNVGVIGATWLMWTGGYRGANLAASAFCKANPNDPSCNVHVQILGGLVDPIGYLSILAIIGAFAGGIGYVLAWRRARRTMKASA